MAQRWQPGPTVAWTESDGPGRVPPVAPRRLAFASAAALGVAAFGVLTANTVCPEHALWIDLLATLTLTLTVTAIVATFKASATAAPLTLAAAIGGLAIASVDAVHEITGGRLVVAAFAVAAVTSAFSALLALRLRQWESSVLADAVRPLPAELSQTPPASDVITADEPVHDRI